MPPIIRPSTAEITVNRKIFILILSLRWRLEIAFLMYCRDPGVAAVVKVPFERKPGNETAPKDGRKIH